jgi:phosphoribosylformylglycinamidine synthase PurS subunit
LWKSLWLSHITTKPTTANTIFQKTKSYKLGTKPNYKGVENVRIGKYVEIELEGKDREQVERQLNQMCEKFLVNPVIEEYRYDIQPMEG